MNLLHQVQNFCAREGFERGFVVAYSGGVDSHVLLHLLVELRKIYSFKLRAIHIHHGIHMHACAWAAHCEEVCRDYHVDCVVKSIKLPEQKGKSLEAIARDGRYRACADELALGEILLTAHHQDDQAETVLLQLMRGAGTKGLAAMPSLKRLGSGFLGRPLLGATRALLMQYANMHGLSFVVDSSNATLQASRNYLRHVVMPTLKTRWHSASSVLARSAKHCASAEQLLWEFACDYLAKLQGDAEGTLSVCRLLALSPGMRRHLLRTWIARAGFLLPSEKKLESINNLLLARSDANPVVKWAEIEVRRYRDDLFIMQALLPQNAQKIVMWDMTTSLFIPALGRLEVNLVNGEGLSPSLGPVSVGFRQGGESFFIPGRGKCKLKNLYQEWGIPPWKRDRIPLIYVGTTLISIPGLFTHSAYVVNKEEVGLKLTWESMSHSTEVLHE